MYSMGHENRTAGRGLTARPAGRSPTIRVARPRAGPCPADRQPPQRGAPGPLPARLGRRRRWLSATRATAPARESRSARGAISFSALIRRNGSSIANGAAAKESRRAAPARACRPVTGRRRPARGRASTCCVGVLRHPGGATLGRQGEVVHAHPPVRADRDEPRRCACVADADGCHDSAVRAGRQAVRGQPLGAGAPRGGRRRGSGPCDGPRRQREQRVAESGHERGPLASAAASGTPVGNVAPWASRRPAARNPPPDVR